MPCKHDGFPVGTLVQFTVTYNNENARRALFSAKTDGHTKRHRKAVTQGTCRMFNMGHMVTCMTGKKRTVFEVRSDLCVGQKPVMMQDGVQAGGCVAFAQNNAVAIRSIGANLVDIDALIYRITDLDHRKC